MRLIERVLETSGGVAGSQTSRQGVGGAGAASKGLEHSRFGQLGRVLECSFGFVAHPILDHRGYDESPEKTIRMRESPSSGCTPPGGAMQGALLRQRGARSGAAAHAELLQGVESVREEPSSAAVLVLISFARLSLETTPCPERGVDEDRARGRQGRLWNPGSSAAAFRFRTAPSQQR